MEKFRLSSIKLRYFFLSSVFFIENPWETQEFTLTQTLPHKIRPVTAENHSRVTEEHLFIKSYVSNKRNRKT